MKTELKSGQDDNVRTYKILAYGIERKGFTAPDHIINNRNYTICFEPFNTLKRFDEFDGVIIFQGIFEKFERKIGDFHSYLLHKYEQDELDKRTKELTILLKNKGFACFVLCEKFIDYDDNNRHETDYTETDLTKRFLNIGSLNRNNLSDRTTDIHSVRNEFNHFFENHGATNSCFTKYSDENKITPIATVGHRLAGMIIEDKAFFVPALLPKNIPEKIEQYFSELTTALVACRNKVLLEVPAWINAFRFSQETALLSEKECLDEKIMVVTNELQQFENYKRILLFDGDLLVEEVNNVLTSGFGLLTDTYDELKEDLKILDSDKKPVIFLEIKGSNRGVQREHINQADSHRERAELPANFPSLLIVNTHIKNARTITEKNQDIASEQIRHAVKQHVLILRTLDLLWLLHFFMEKIIPQDQLISLLTENIGWLKVDEKSWKIITE